MDYISGWCRSDARLGSKTAIVTGANSGIGRETARELFKRGARVILACRNLNLAEDSRNEMERQLKGAQEPIGMLVVRHLDLASLQSVRDFSRNILESESNVDIVVNNAGVMACPKGETADGFEMQMGTNHLGHALLTLLLLPKLRSSAHSRIIFVSSKVHQSYTVDLEDINFENKMYNPLEAYCRSKSANILFARELARKLKELNIDNINTYSLHPGIVHTELGRHFSSTVWPGATWLWHNVLSWFLKSPRCGAQTSIHCAVDEVAASQSGLYYSDCAVAESSKETQSDAAGTKLWDITIQLLNLTDYDPFHSHI